MIKFSIKRSDRMLLGLGLSGENMARLQSDEPIHIPYATLVELLGDALTGVVEFDIVIIGGATEEAMREQLSPFIGPDTKILE